MQSSGPWSRLPSELAREVTGHNADDVPALRALSLVSKAMRSLAIEELFSVIRFGCAEDVAQWPEMLDRTPRLGNVVRKVKFSRGPNRSWLQGYRNPVTTPLSDSAIPPIIPPMLSVRVVEWHDTNARYGVSFQLGMAVAYMALFPKVQKVYLSNIYFDRRSSLTKFLGVCGTLKVLSLLDTYPTVSGSESDSSDVSGTPDSFDLTELEELVVSSTYIGHKDFLIPLLERSRLLSSSR
ncbi:hypothetical protein B0H17DRAFT_125098 [Mycena rosella]|uniref:F-box domain-containing protein n=1 Tax=Mycena rosella TaxID=1033263 RepID=A0AAD7D373_MYCRO|nr:hypothetical protein B0H17DRAFT_125098 [Mycena rosella]